MYFSKFSTCRWTSPSSRVHFSETVEPYYDFISSLLVLPFGAKEIVLRIGIELVMFTVFL